jgi:hypothetical protein
MVTRFLFRGLFVSWLFGVASPALAQGLVRSEAR